MKGILVDVNCEGHFRALLYLMQEESRREFWTYLNLATLTFADLGLAPTAPDVAVWQKCQQEHLVLVTGNRNYDRPDSLEAAIRNLNTADSLPVFTIGDMDRILHERSYAEQAADKFLQDLFDIENYRGSGRVYIP